MLAYASMRIWHASMGGEVLLSYHCIIPYDKLSLMTGGSAIKIIYTTEEGENVRFNFVTYSREQHKEAFSMLSEKYSDKLEPGSEVFTCGVGGSEYNQELTTLFNLKLVSRPPSLPPSLLPSFPPSLPPSHK